MSCHGCGRHGLPRARHSLLPCPRHTDCPSVYHRRRAGHHHSHSRGRSLRVSWSYCCRHGHCSCPGCGRYGPHGARHSLLPCLRHTDCPSVSHRHGQSHCGQSRMSLRESCCRSYHVMSRPCQKNRRRVMMTRHVMTHHASRMTGCCGMSRYHGWSYCCCHGHRGPHGAHHSPLLYLRHTDLPNGYRRHRGMKNHGMKSHHVTMIRHAKMNHCGLMSPR